MRAGQLTLQVEHIEEVGQMAQQALKELRLLLFELRPATLGAEGLFGALQQRLEAVEKRSGLRTSLHIVPMAGSLAVKTRQGVTSYPTLPAQVEEGLYRIAQEALNNALKHSGATAVDVYIYLSADCIGLEIRDDGVGFTVPDQDQRQIAGGFGLESMRQRAEKLGRKLLVSSTPGKGTSVKVVDVPISMPKGVGKGNASGKAYEQ
jgi:signal transduction histidine kinase